MDQASYSPHPSMDSASDYTPERATHTSPTKRRPRGSMTAEERRDARAHRNRLAAQSSRDRKKAQFEQLATRVAELEDENRSLRLGLARPSSSPSSSSLEAGLLKENQDLRARVQQLELAWQNMTKILATMAIPVPLPSSSASTSALPATMMMATTRPTTNTPLSNDPKLPLSPAPTSSSSSDSLDAITSEPTCELAAGGSFGALFGDQIVGGADQVGTTTVFDNNNNITITNNTITVGNQWAECGMFLNPKDTTLTDGYSEMDQLLALLPSSSPHQESTLDIGVTNADEWNWLNEGAF